MYGKMVIKSVCGLSHEAEARLNQILGDVADGQIIKAIGRSGNLVRALENLNPEEIERLKTELSGLYSGKGLGRHSAEDMAGILRILISDPAATISKGQTPHTTYVQLKQLKRSITASITASDSAFIHTFLLGEKEYAIVFDPQNRQLQNQALESVQSCFSSGGVYRGFAENYLNGNDIFFAQGD